MPRSKKNIKVDLAKTRQHGLEGKKGLVREIQNCCDRYEHLFIFSVNDMRNSKMKDVRQQWKDSRFFIGKNKVMTIALGRTPEEEYKPNLQKVSKLIAGQKGLLFSNKPVHEVIQWFNSYTDGDFARSGNVATESVTLPEGPLAQFPHSMEAYLRQLGLPTTLKKGVIHLLSDYVVCNEGDVLSPETARILKLLGYQMAEFQLKIECVWSRDGTFEDFGSDGKENGDEPPKKKRRVESMDTSSLGEEVERSTKKRKSSKKMKVDVEESAEMADEVEESAIMADKVEKSPKKRKSTKKMNVEVEESEEMADEVEESAKMADEVTESTKMADEVKEEEDMIVDEDESIPQLVENASLKVKQPEDEAVEKSVKLEKSEVADEAEHELKELKYNDEKAEDKAVEDKDVEDKDVDENAKICEVSRVDIKDENMKEVSVKEEKAVHSTVSPKEEEDSEVVTQDEVEEETAEADSEVKVAEEKDLDKKAILKMTEEKIETETEETKKFSPKLTRSRAKATNQKVVTPDERLLRSARKPTKRKA